MALSALRDVCALSVCASVFLCVCVYVRECVPVCLFYLLHLLAALSSSFVRFKVLLMASCCLSKHTSHAGPQGRAGGRGVADQQTDSARQRDGALYTPHTCAAAKYIAKASLSLAPPAVAVPVSPLSPCSLCHLPLPGQALLQSSTAAAAALCLCSCFGFGFRLCFCFICRSQLRRRRRLAFFLAFSG